MCDGIGEIFDDVSDVFFLVLELVLRLRCVTLAEEVAVEVVSSGECS